MKRTLLIAVIALLGLVLGWITWFWQPDARQPHSPIPLAAAPSGGDFTLQSANGPVSLHDFRGKVVLVYFGYTFCPDICPTSLAFTSQALNALDKDELARTQALFISVDPERDTLEKLKEYGTFFHPGILGLTGTPEAIAATARQYGASYRKQDTGSAGGYVVDHSSSTYVVDSNGKLVATLQHGTPPAEVVKAIRAAMQGRQ
ncbi:MAG: SCO family protein [Nitrosomonadales bacterium]|nr:MAG: SCO family protein [Nitrosomonadales bacterium]